MKGGILHSLEGSVFFQRKLLSEISIQTVMRFSFIRSLKIPGECTELLEEPSKRDAMLSRGQLMDRLLGLLNM